MRKINRRLAKSKTTPRRASVASLLRFYAPDEDTYLEAMKASQNARERGLEPIAKLTPKK